MPIKQRSRFFQPSLKANQHHIHSKLEASVVCRVDSRTAWNVKNGLITEKFLCWLVDSSGKGTCPTTDGINLVPGTNMVEGKN